jgi:phosphohistidine swiveling domain-containing protein
LPLSPAHADLIRLIDQRCQLGFRQKVTGGDLFFSHDAGAAALLTANTPTTTEATPVRRQLASLEVELGRRISALGPAPTLEAALDLFAAIYQRLFAVLQPATRRAKAALQVFLEAHLPDGRDALPGLLGEVPSVATDRRRAAARVRAAASAPVRLTAVKDYLATFGDEAPVWDVAAPTYREDPSLLERLPALPTADLARLATLARPAMPGDAFLTSPDGEMSWQRASRAIDARLPVEARAIWPRLLREARDAVAVAEEDDHLYARLQAVVRRALLREGERLRVEGVLTAADEIFYLPLDRVRAHARRTSILSREDAAAHLQRARNAEEAARRAPPPLPPSSARRAAGLAGDTIVYGLAGAGGRVVGRAFLYPAPPGAVPDRTSIIVATTLLPAELPLVDAAAIVVETGGVLGHVAAQARERGIPAVVAAAGARGAIKFGDELLVDGDAGYVLRL